MSIFDFESVHERRIDFVQEGMDAKLVLDTGMWIKAMFTSVESIIFKNDNSETKSKPMMLTSIDPELQTLSQKVMKAVWDNKDDEFWDTY